MTDNKTKKAHIPEQNRNSGLPDKFLTGEFELTAAKDLTGSPVAGEKKSSISDAKKIGVERPELKKDPESFNGSVSSSLVVFVEVASALSTYLIGEVSAFPE